MSEPGIRERLVGCWRLVGYSVTTEGGQPCLIGSCSTPW
jgi:hypothetical protein